MIAGQCGFAGSAKIGNFVQIGGQTGIGGHIKISDFVKIAAKSGVIRDIAKGETVMGYPAINLNKYLKNYKKSMM
jgi:UDP-3-O-[3-hydroxymyristoyl] glucosamine N-acyltransferase